VLTDTHCHLYLNSFQNDLTAVLERAWSAGVERILVPGIDLNTSRQAIELADSDARIFAAVGVHPNDSLAWNETTLDELRLLAKHPRVVAIGEIGLDYYRERAPHDHQRNVFRAQLELAAETGLPVIIHTRQARSDSWQMLANWHAELVRSASRIHQHPGVLHSFDGSLAEAEESIARGFLISFSGPVTYKNATNLHQAATALPLSNLLVETDAPYLPPLPYRGQRNEPAHVARIVEQIARLRQIPMEMLAHQTTHNAAMLFRWINPD